MAGKESLADQEISIPTMPKNIIDYARNLSKKTVRLSVVAEYETHPVRHFIGMSN